MKKEYKRREFVSCCFKAGAACAFITSGGGLLTAGTIKTDKPDPKKLEYCGYKCPDDCLLKKGTLENNIELKKKAWEEFGMKQNYGIDFEPDKIFCYGCKPSGKPAGTSAKRCKVRQCVISKGLDCCIECDSLSKCDKDLWKNFPKLREKVLSLQIQYKS